MPNALRTDRQGFSTVPRRGAVALATTILAVLLLFGFKTGDQASATPVLPTAGVIGAPSRTPSTPDVAGAPPPTPTVPSDGTVADPTLAPATPTPAGGTQTFTGNVIQTPYGAVQVAIVMSGGRIVDVLAPQLPSDRRLSQQISGVAGPLLRSQVLRAQSAKINGVSGASYTSEGYYESLQSALAKVH